MRMMQFGLWTLVAAAIVVASPDSPVAAQAGGATGQADALIDEGVALRRQGDDEGALARFRAAFELSRSGRARAQIALVEQALARWIDAEAHLLEALSSHEAWIEERRATLEQQLEVIRSHLGQVRIIGGVPGAEVTVNGRAVGTLPIASALWVEPGSAEIIVRADGYRPYHRSLEAPTGQLVTLAVELESSETTVVVRAPPEPSTPPQVISHPDADDGPPLDAIGWAGVGVGGAALLVSAIALGLRNGEAETFNSPMCLEGGLSRGENCATHYNAARTWESVSIGTLLAGIALAGTGAALVIVDATNGSGSERIACAPAVGGTVGMTCAGTF